MAKNKKAPAGLHGQEVEALAIGMKALPQMIKNLVVLANSSSESQQRQAIEVFLRYFMADRALQMQADGTVVSGGNTNITLNKVDVQILAVMEKLPPALQQKYAEVMEEIEVFAAREDIEIFEGELPGEQKTCKCGCGTPVKGTWVKGHQFKAHVASDKVLANRAGNPLKMNEAKKAKREQGQLPPAPAKKGKKS